MSYTEITVAQLEDNGAVSIQTGPFGTQLKASDYTDKGVPVINVRNIGYGDLRPEKLEFVPEGTAERLSVHVLQASDIVFGRKGAVDRHLFVSDGQHGWVQGSDCIRLRLSKDRINPRFASYAFLRPYHKEWMLRQCGNKATMASLNQDVIRRIVLPFPEPEEQLDIVSILSAYDDLFSNNRRRITLLEEAARLLYREWFVHFRFPGHKHVKIIDGLPDRWEWRTLGVVAENYDRKRVPLSVLDRDQRRGGFPYYGAAGILDYIDDYLFNGRYLLMGEDGTVITERGTPLLQLVEGKFWVNNHAHVLRGKDLSTEHLYCALNEYRIQGHVTGVAQPKITQKSMNRIPITVAPDNLRREFQDIVSPLFAQRFALETQNESLHRARDLILPRLMNGEIAV